MNNDETEAMTYPLDSEITSIQGALKHLSPKHVAIFSAACSERLLPIYEAFVAEDRWGDSASLQKSLELVWRSLVDRAVLPEQLERQVEIVQQLTPDLDTFDSVVSALAVDVCICVDAALRSLATECAVVSAVEYGLNAIRKAECVKATGCLDLGDTAEAAQFENEAVKNTSIRNELEAQKVDLQKLQRCDKLTSDAVGGFLANARANKVDSNELLRGLVR